MPGGKHVGKLLDQQVAEAIADERPRDQIFVTMIALYGCSRQTVLRSYQRVTNQRPTAPPPAPRDSKPKPLARTAFVTRIVELATAAYDRKPAEASRLEDRVSQALQPAIRRVEQLAPPVEKSRLSSVPLTAEPEPSPEYSEAREPDAPPRRQREQAIGLTFDDPSDSYRAAVPRSGRPPELGMRPRDRLALPVVAAATRAPGTDMTDLEIAMRVPRLRGDPRDPTSPLGAAIAEAEANKKPGWLPGDPRPAHAISSFAAQSDSERALLGERVRAKRRRERRVNKSQA